MLLQRSSIHIISFVTAPVCVYTFFLYNNVRFYKGKYTAARRTGSNHSKELQALGYLYGSDTRIVEKFEMEKCENFISKKR